MLFQLLKQSCNFRSELINCCPLCRYFSMRFWLTHNILLDAAFLCLWGLSTKLCHSDRNSFVISMILLLIIYLRHAQSDKNNCPHVTFDETIEMNPWYRFVCVSACAILKLQNILKYKRLIDKQINKGNLKLNCLAPDGHYIRSHQHIPIQIELVIYKQTYKAKSS